MLVRDESVRAVLLAVPMPEPDEPVLPWAVELPEPFMLPDVPVLPVEPVLPAALVPMLPVLPVLPVAPVVPALPEFKVVLPPPCWPALLVLAPVVPPCVDDVPPVMPGPGEVWATATPAAKTRLATVAAVIC
ncbi:MAG: hypothetical protein ACK40L_00505 [Hydrogenophaga sp.]